MVMPNDERYIRQLERENSKLKQQLNRVKNLTPGTGRLHELAKVADEFDYLAEDGPTDDEVTAMNVAYAVFIRRLEWDLFHLNWAVTEKRQRSGKYDATNWIGERP